MKARIVLLALAGTLAVTAAQAQNPADSDHSVSLAPADAATSSASDVREEGSSQAKLAKKLQNPISNLISVPIQSNWDFGIGPAHAMRYTANIQPVVPLSISKDWNLIIRTILPVIYAESPIKGGSDDSGLGDTTQSFFFSPKEPVGGWIVGAGPVALWPTETDEDLGVGKWGAGPTVVALQQRHGFTYGVLANHIWSYAGWGDHSVDSTFLQPFASFTTKTYTTFGVNTESTYDWHAEQWTVPLNFMISQLVKIGGEPIQFQVGYRYYADGPSGGPDWGLRFAVTFLFPKE
ncbi:MAG: transporter [Deltaproteobacteria bacterium]|nr:transporter [Deltaproteobacteria bacterium]